MTSEHPITIEKSSARIIVTAADKAVADTREALLLREAHYPPVYYLPQKDVDMSLLEHSDHESFCPHKGSASYYTIRVGEKTFTNAVWTYQKPLPEVRKIQDHVAFSPGAVTITQT